MVAIGFGVGLVITTCGQGGRDVIQGRRGDDLVYGGKGRDIMFGGFSDELLMVAVVTIFLSVAKAMTSSKLAMETTPLQISEKGISGTGLLSSNLVQLTREPSCLMATVPPHTLSVRLKKR